MFQLRRRPTRFEVLVLSLGAIAVFSMIGLFFRKSVEVEQSRLNPATIEGSAGILTMDPRRVSHVEVEITPENLRAMDAEVPVLPGCEKVHYKPVPIQSVKINGVLLEGKYQARYRGFCHPHWYYKQKSLKIRHISGDLLAGYRELVLNSLETEAEFFEPWASLVMEASGGIASRAGLIRLSINGQYDGLRSIIQNIDSDLVRTKQLPEGPIYREILHAHLGAHWENPKNHWQKNARKQLPWTDWVDFNKAIYDSVLEKNRKYLEHLNLSQAINYYAVLNFLGVAHVNNHNIPMYRPDNRKEFIPIGYDMAGNSMGVYASEIKELQIPTMSFNLLSGLIMADPVLRAEVHKRMVWMIQNIPYLRNGRRELFEGFRAQIIKEKAEGLILQHPVYRDTERYLATVDREFVMSENRFDMLRQWYLEPVAHINPLWKEKKSFQMAVDGMGIYSLDIEPDRETCGAQDRVLARFHTSGWQAALSCKDGRWEKTELLVERSDLIYPEKPESEFLYMNQTSIGPIWIEVEKQGNSNIKGIVLTSKQTQLAVPVQEDWPFHFSVAGEGVIRLGENLPPVVPLQDLKSRDGIVIVNPKRLTDSFTVHENLFTVPRKTTQSLTMNYDKFGPTLCYRLGQQKNCFEFNRRFLVKNNFVEDGYFESVPDVPAPQAQGPAAKVLAKEDIVKCKKFVFTKGNWSVPAPLRFPASCEVEFESGAVIALGMDAYILMEGPSSFPTRAPFVTFKKLSRYNWGALVFRGNPQKTIVRNVLFQDSGDFFFEGKMLTGPLIFIDSTHELAESSILIKSSVQGELGLNGGAGQIKATILPGHPNTVRVGLPMKAVQAN